jgi:hypothetical protein
VFSYVSFSGRRNKFKIIVYGLNYAIRILVGNRNVSRTRKDSWTPSFNMLGA